MSQTNPLFILKLAGRDVVLVTELKLRPALWKECVALS